MALKMETRRSTASMVAFYAFWGTNRRNFSSMPSQKGITETWWDNSHDWWIMVDGSRCFIKRDGKEEEEEESNAFSVLRRTLCV